MKRMIENAAKIDKNVHSVYAMNYTF